MEFLGTDHESNTRSSDNPISSDFAVGGFRLRSSFQIVMLGKRKCVFLTPYFQFEKKLSFRVCAA